MIATNKDRNTVLQTPSQQSLVSPLASKRDKVISAFLEQPRRMLQSRQGRQEDEEHKELLVIPPSSKVVKRVSMLEKEVLNKLLIKYD